MKLILKPLFVGLCLLSMTLGFGQKQEDLIQWDFNIVPETFAIGDEVTLELHATIDDKWYIYGAQFDCDPQNTELDFSEGVNKGYEVNGQLTSPGDKLKHDDIFGCDYRYMHGKADFKLPIKITGQKVQIDALVVYQLCTVEEGMCIPFEKALLVKKKAAKAVTKEPEEETGGIIADPPVKQPDVSIPGDCACCDSLQAKTDEILHKLDNASLTAGNPASHSAAKATGGSSTCDIPRRAGWDDFELEPYAKDEGGDDWVALLLFMGVAFLAGFTALLTPCVFPMIPMTVSFFTKSNESRAKGIGQALLYGFFIILIYVLIGIGAAKIFGPTFAHSLSTHWLPNSLFFIIFIIFALSFLGLFEITLPSRFVNNVDRQADKGGLIGIFFMAFTLVLVSFSCTGPIVGSLLSLSFDGSILKPALGMFGFALAFALPFTLFAMFPSWMNKLPKSGGWLNEVKVFLGLLELALALKFLSQVDQLLGWRILDREVFLALWIVIFATTGFYLLGKIRMKSDSEVSKVGVFRLLLVIGLFSFVMYLIPGMWGAPNKMMAGLLPPRSTQDFDIERMIRATNQGDSKLCEEPLYADEFHLPHGLQGYFDLRQAVCCAMEQDKPLFIDFTGKTCANCRMVEETVWSDPRVLTKLNEEFVLVSLYTDSFIKLDKEDRYEGTTGTTVRKVGQLNLDFENRFYGKVSQPTYSIVAVDELKSTEAKIKLKELSPTTAYEPNVDKYLEFIDKGIKNHKNFVAGKALE